MVAVTGHFDGKVLVLDTPVDLPRNRKLKIQVEPAEDGLPEGTDAEKLFKHAGHISREDLDRMAQAIEEGCEQVDPDGW